MKSAMIPSLAIAAVVAASATAAEARSNISLSIGAPVYYEPAPVYVAPRPVYYEPVPAYYYVPPTVFYYSNNGYERHRHYDWNRWHDNGRHRGWEHGRGHR